MILKKVFLLVLLLLFAELSLAGCNTEAASPTPSATPVASRTSTPSFTPTFDATNAYRTTLQANQTQNAAHANTQAAVSTGIAQTQAVEALTPTATRTPLPSPSPTSIPAVPTAGPTVPLSSPDHIQWDETSSLPLASAAPFDDRRGQQLIFHNGFVYVFGGWSASNNRLRDVYFSAIQADGSLSAWAGTTPLPGSYYDQVVVKVGDFVYLITGAASSVAVEYAPLNPDGHLGAWQGTAPLAPSRQQFAATSYGAFIYVTGGNSGGTQDFVFYTSVKTDGSLNDWSTASNPLPVPVEAHTMFAYNGYLYVFGGRNANNSQLTTVYYAPVNPNGAPGTWKAITALPAAMSGFSTFEWNGNVYLVGGSSSKSYYAPILENHALGAWGEVTALPNKKILALRAGAYNGFAYAIGGFKNQYLSAAYFGPIGEPVKATRTPPPATGTQVPASPTPVSGTLTPSVLACQLSVNQQVKALAGANLWSEPNAVTGTITGTLAADTTIFILGGAEWGPITTAGVSGWWWEVSLTSGGPSVGWVWEGRIEECN